MTEERRSAIRARALKGAVNLGVRNVLVRVISLLGLVVLSRLLSKYEFGILAFGLTIKVLSDVIAGGGLAAGLVRRPEAPSRRELGAMVFFQGTISLLLVLLLLGAGAVWGTAASVAAVMATGLVVSAFRVPSVVVLERELDWSLVAKIEVIEMLVYNVAAVTAVALGAGVWGVAGASAVGSVIGTVLLLRIGPVGFVVPRPEWRLIRVLIGFGARFQATGLVVVFRDQGLNLIVAAVGGLVVLGVWSIAYRLLQVVLLLLQTLWRVSYPAMARAIEAGDDASLLIARVLQLCTTVIALLAAGLAGTAPALVHVVFGATWADAGDVLPWGAAALAVWGPMSTACTGFLQARDDTLRLLVVVVLQSLVWFAITIALLPGAGAEAVGIGMFGASIVYAIGSARLVHSHARAAFVRIMWAPLVSGTLGAALGLLTCDALGTDVVALAASSVVSVGAFVAALAVLRRSDLTAVVALARRRRTRPSAAA